MKHLDTGAMYRAISWLLNQEKIDPENDLAIENALKVPFWIYLKMEE